MASTFVRYLVVGHEVVRQEGRWKFQTPPFCPNRPFTVEFGDDVFAQTTLELGCGYRVVTSAAIWHGTPSLLYWLENDGSPFSDHLLGLTKGSVDGSDRPASAQGAPFPYWHFYANVLTDLKAWIRFAEAAADGSRRADFAARDEKELRGVPATVGKAAKPRAR